MKKLKPLRVLVTGGTSYGVEDDGKAYAAMVQLLNQISQCGARHTTIIHDGRHGAAGLASHWVFNTKTPYECYPDDPALLSKSKADMLLAFPGSEPALVTAAREHGMRVFEVAA